MAKSRGGGGPGSPGGSLAGTRESLAEPGGDELSSLGSDSEVNGGGGPEERRVDKFGFIVGSRGAEGT